MWPSSNPQTAGCCPVAQWRIPPAIGLEPAAFAHQTGLEQLDAGDVGDDPGEGGHSELEQMSASNIDHRDSRCPIPGTQAAFANRRAHDGRQVGPTP